jgi:hypothetical protein
VVVSPFPAFAAAPEKPAVKVELIASTVVDRAALNFVKGRFGTCINGQTFQQEAVVSFNGFQYAVYFADGGVLSIARRKLPRGEWETIHFKDYGIDHTDVHNVVVIGICEGDGTIHLSYDHHGHPLHYRRSVPKVALEPKKFDWTPRRFGKTTDELERGKPLTRVTYPQFFSVPNKKLQLIYRIGSSGNGDWYLAEYDPKPGRWTTVGMVCSREGRYLTSPHRCAYINPPRYDEKSRLHITWCWRERPASGARGLETNHDLCYAYSDDFGRTWKKNDGDLIAALGRRRLKVPPSIYVNTPGTVVRETRYLWGQMNTVTQYVDSKRRVHVVHWQHQQDAKKASSDMNTWRYNHYWRDTDGTWHENRLPFFGRKPQIVLDDAGNALVIYCKGKDLNYHTLDPGGRLTIAGAAEDGNWTNWKTLWAADRESVGEPLYDPQRWRTEHVLSIYTQDKPAKAGAPSALRVLDFRPPARKE